MTARSDNEQESSRRVKTEFLVQMQGVGNANDVGVLVLGATNLPWALDSAIRRRFEKRIYIPLPDYEARLYLLKRKMKKEDHNITDGQFESLAKEIDGFTGSDINQLVKNACYEPLRKFQDAVYFKKIGTNSKGQPIYMACSKSEPGSIHVDKDKLNGDQIKKNVININDFFKAIGNTKPSVSQEDLKQYEKWTDEYGIEG